MTRPDPDPLFLAWRQSGDPSALGAVFDACAPELQHLAERLCGRGPDADDVLQATFLAAIESADRFDASRRLLPWLVGIMTLHVRRLHERRLRRREQPREASESEEMPAATPTPAQSATQAELHGEVRAAIAQLPPLQRLVVEACLVQQLPPHEVASRLGIPEGTCRMRLHRGLESLRALLPASLAGSLLAMVPGASLLPLRNRVLAHAASLRRPTRHGHTVLRSLAAVAAATVALLAVLLTLFQLSLTTRATPDLPTTPPAIAVANNPVAEAGPAAEALAKTNASDRDRSSTATPNGTLELELTFPDGTPAPGIGLQCSQPDGVHDFRDGLLGAITDAAGRTTVADLRPGFVFVLTDREVAERYVITAGQTESARMVVPRGTRVNGVVVAADGTPVGDAEVRLIVRGDIKQVIARTAADGSFAADDVPTVHTGLIARANDHGPSQPIAMATSMPLLRLQLSQSTELLGVLTDPNGRAVRGAKIGALSDHDQAWAAMPESRTTTDDRGTFRFGSLPAATVRLMIAAKGFAPWQQTITLAPGTTRLPIQLTGGQSLRGRLQTPEGNGPGVAMVEVVTGAPELGHQRITGIDGRFEVDAIHQGPITLYVYALGFRRLLTTLPERTDDTEVVLPLEPLLVCNGTLLDSERKPLAGWRIGFDPHGTNLELTAGDGRFACHSPAGTVDVCWIAAPLASGAAPRDFHRIDLARAPADGSRVEVVVDPTALTAPDTTFQPESSQPPFMPRRTLVACAPPDSRGPQPLLGATRRRDVAAGHHLDAGAPAVPATSRRRGHAARCPWPVVPRDVPRRGTACRAPDGARLPARVISAAARPCRRHRRSRTATRTTRASGREPADPAPSAAPAAACRRRRVRPSWPRTTPRASCRQRLRPVPWSPR